MINRFERRFEAIAGRGRSWRFALVAAFLVSSACFLGSAVLMRLQARELADHAHAISGNSMPSTVALASLRFEVNALERDLDRSMRYRNPAPLAIDALATAEDVCERLPHFEGEAVLWNEARAAVEAFRHEVLAAARLMAAGNWEGARVAFENGVEPSARTSEAALARNIELNARMGEAAAEAVEARRIRASTLGLVLDATSALVSAFALLVSLRVVRRHTRSIEDRAHALEDFASRVAHDIRGPLTAPLFALECATRDQNPDSTRQAAKLGLRSLKRVLGIVDDLLAFARTAGTPEMGGHTNARAVAEGVVEEIRPLADARKARVRVEAAEDAEVACSPGILASILSNLLRNAVKYLGNASVRDVTVRIRPRGTVVRIEVEDTGPGVPEHMRDAIFEPYVRAHRGGDGLGLGLATVSKLVRAHGGAVTVASRTGGGSVFSVDLPLAGLAVTG